MLLLPSDPLASLKNKTQHLTRVSNPSLALNIQSSCPNLMHTQLISPGWRYKLITLKNIQLHTDLPGRLLEETPLMNGSWKVPDFSGRWITSCQNFRHPLPSDPAKGCIVMCSTKMDKFIDYWCVYFRVAFTCFFIPSTSSCPSLREVDSRSGLSFSVFHLLENKLVKDLVTGTLYGGQNEICPTPRYFLRKN